MVKQFSFSVDVGKPKGFTHRTRGMYQVAARNEKEARKFLQRAIGFGSIGKGHEISEEFFRQDHDMSGRTLTRWKLPYGTVKKFFLIDYSTEEAKRETDKVENK